MAGSVRHRTAVSAALPRIDTQTRRVAGACLFAAGVHIACLTLPLGVDEGGVALVGQHLLTSHDHGSSLYGNLWIDRPPLLIVAMGIAQQLAGSIGVRLLGLVAAVSLVALCAAGARRMGVAAAAAPAAVIAAVLASVPTLSANLAPQELLAAPLSAAAVVLVMPALRSRRVTAMHWLGAGLFASCALLVKQSFLDALVACATIALLHAHRQRSLRHLAPLAAGVVLPLVATFGWAGLESKGVGAMLYALVGFRIAGASALAHASVGMGKRIDFLVAGFVSVGLPVLLPLTLVGIDALRRAGERPLAIAAAVWTAASLTGVLGGGYYWTHYMIQLVPVLAIFGGIGFTRVRARGRVASAAFVTALCVLVAGSNVVAWASGAFSAHRYRHVVVARYLRDNAHPGDTLYVMYARANLTYESGLTPAFPYQWSLMYRTLPGIQHQLRSLLASRERPTWLVQWQRPDTFGLDSDGQTGSLVQRYYRQVATVCQVPVLLRRDDARRTHTLPNPDCPAAG